MSEVLEARVVRTRSRVAAIPTIGVDVDAIWKLREEKRALDAQAKRIEEEIATIEERLMVSMKAQGVDKATGSKASVSIGSAVVAHVEDWDTFLTFVYKKKYGHLLQRRVSEPAYRELLEQRVVVPGVQPFTRSKLNLRSLG